MMSKYREIDLSGLRKYSIKDRPSKVSVNDFAKPEKVSMRNFLSGLPDILQAKKFNELLKICENAVRNRKGFIVALGGHFIKCGLSPYLIDFMKKGVVTALAANGSVTIHDFEIAAFGKTSEDVADALEDGSFGMVKETCDTINKVIIKAAEEDYGYGESLGKYLNRIDANHNSVSLLAMADKLDIPFTIHVALGTDINHQHETAVGSAIGDCSLRDFRIFCENLKKLNNGGVFLNFGSAVIMPEVFLKAITVVRNLGFPLRNFNTAVFDMNRHYRPQSNIVDRPTNSGGKGFYFIGHHEIMIPLFFQALQERLQNE